MVFVKRIKLAVLQVWGTRNHPHPSPTSQRGVDTHVDMSSIQIIDTSRPLALPATNKMRERLWLWLSTPITVSTHNLRWIAL